MKRHLTLYFPLIIVIISSNSFTSFATQLTPQDFQIKQLPFYNGNLGHMYSGFLPVTSPPNQTDPNKALFFWLFMNDSKPIDESPLVLWLNGGPGASSQLGLFTQNGPFQILYNQTSKKPYFVQNKYSWSTISHFLVVDQPAGTGYSYVKQQKYLVTTDQQVAIDFRHFLNNFFKVFNNLKQLPFYVTGESYCGKYLPYISNQILSHPQDQINLTAMILGNGYIDPVNQRVSMSYVAQSIGLISGNQLGQLDNLQKKCIKSFQTDKDNSQQYCNKIPEYIELVSGGIDIYNVQQFADDSTQPFQLYLNGNYTTDVLNVLHVQNSPKHPIYEVSSQAVDKAMSKVNTNSSIPIVNSLLQKGFPMFWYIGQFDGQDGVKGHQVVLGELDWDSKNDFDQAPRWFYIPTSKTKVAGYFKQIENFTWMIFSGAGHLVPSNQPKNALLMIQDYINNNNSLPLNPGYNNAQAAMCQFMNYCSGHGSCDSASGICQCDDGYLGQDCSKTLDQSFQGTHRHGNQIKISLRPQSWYYFKSTSDPKKSQHLSFLSQNQQKFSIYGIRKKNGNLQEIPDKNKFDYKIQEVQSFVHYVEQQGQKQTYNQQIIAVYNPCFKYVSNIRITGLTIYGHVQVRKEKSFWSAPNFGFWIFIIVLVGTVVSLIFNYYHYRVLKRLSKHSYTSRDLTSSENYGTNIESKISSKIDDGNQKKNRKSDEMKQQLLHEI